MSFLIACFCGYQFEDRYVCPQCGELAPDLVMDALDETDA